MKLTKAQLFALRSLPENKGFPLFLWQVAEALGGTRWSGSPAMAMLRKLVDLGALERTKNHMYRITDVGRTALSEAEEK